jgi:hypothetical protein
VDFISKYASEIWSFIAGLAGGAAGGSLLTFKLTKHKAGRDTNVVNQASAEAGGDVVGRDKRVSEKRE